MPHDWVMGAIGGLMIGTAAALYLLGNGRIMGASGIAASVVDGSAGAALTERLAFLAGLIALPALMVAFGLGAVSAPVAGTGGLVFAGLCVGVGTRLANGCTSGHGVCGLSRLSRRALVATVTFMAFGVLAVLARHWAG